MNKIRIAIASDLSGFPLKDSLVKYFKEERSKEIEIINFGINDVNAPKPYFEQASKVAKAILKGDAEKGILICGTGQGMAIVANKHKGIYATVAVDIFSGERGKIINNSNIITLGGWITAPFHGIQIVKSWLEMSFTQKMEFKKDFLTNAFENVKKIEDENFK